MIRPTARRTQFGQIFVIASLFVGVVMVSSLVLLLQQHKPTAAISGSDFNPGRIIDDYVFYDETAMNAASIQSFLQERVSACDTQGSLPASEFGRPDLTRAQYAASRGWHGPPYTCLRDYRQSTPQMEAASGLCEGISASPSRTGSEIIHEVARACHINPKVLIVLLQKEQSLVTDTWPLQSQFRNATGFACPDTAPCDPSYNGFFYQVYYAARQFQIYKKYPNSYNYIAGRINNIYYNPDLSRCGSSQIYIENQATAALYIYTPYQPNAAALNNLYGTGDSCSSYGNRNFWRLFTEWFGTTYYSFTTLDYANGGPRWMTLNKDTRKVIPGTNIQTEDAGDTVLPQGTHLWFVDKVYLNGEWYLRTSYDHQRHLYKGIRLADVSEITNYVPFITPRWMTIWRDTQKVNPVNGGGVGQPLATGTQLRFSDKLLVNGQWYYRTAFDRTNSNRYAVAAVNVEEIAYEPFDDPRYLRTNKAATILDPVIGTVATTLPENEYLHFNSKVLVNNQWYYRSSEDTAEGLSRAISQSDLEEAYQSFESPRALRLTTDTYKVDPLTNTTSTDFQPAGVQIFFSSKIYIDDVWYYRSKFNTDRNESLAIPAELLQEL